MTVMLSSPQQWSVWPRDRSNESVIIVAGFTTTPAAGNSVRIGPEGGTLVDVDTFDAFGNFTGSFTGSTGRVGITVEVYETATPANVVDSLTISEVDVGVNLVTLSQSNHTIHAETIWTSTHGGQMDADGNWSQVSQRNEMGVFAQYMWDTFGIPVGIQVIAVGETSWLDWALGSPLWQTWRARLQRFLDLGRVAGCIVRLGESDAAAPLGADATESKTRLKTLIKTIAKTTPILFFLTKFQNMLGVSTTDQSDVYDGFDEAVAEVPNARVGADLSDLDDDQGLSPNHLVLDAKVTTAGQRQAVVVHDSEIAQGYPDP